MLKSGSQWGGIVTIIVEFLKVVALFQMLISMYAVRYYQKVKLFKIDQI